MTKPDVSQRQSLRPIAADPAAAQTEHSAAILRTVTAVLGHWRFIVIAAVLGALILALPPLFRSRLWQSSASFMPQTPRNMANMSGLAMQLGVAIPQAEPGQSPQFYAELLKSHEILRNVATATYTFPPKGSRNRSPRTLVDREKSHSPELGPARLEQRAIDRLVRHISVSVSAKTGVVSFSVKEEDAVLARDIADKLLSELNRFNLETRQSQAAAERRFTEQRLKEAAESLRNAEARRQAFTDQNRAFGRSSRLTLQEERLNRDVFNAQQVYTTLLTAYEEARIDEVRDTPVITVIQPPRVPVLPVSRGVASRGLIGLMIGLSVGALIALLRRRISDWRAASTPAWMELESLLRRSR